MDREKILATLQELPVETRVKAWIFQIDKKFYHVCEHGGVYGVLEKTSIWECNKRGKRATTEAIFNNPRKDHIACINAFLNNLEEQQKTS